MKSVIYMNDLVQNTGPKFGAAHEYYPVKIVDFDGNESMGFFTDAELRHAEVRALNNPEDVEYMESWLARLSKWIKGG